MYVSSNDWYAKFKSSSMLMETVGSDLIDDGERAHVILSLRVDLTPDEIWLAPDDLACRVASASDPTEAECWTHIKRERNLLRTSPANEQSK